MVDEIDIYRTVKMFIEWHGDDAALQASMKTDEMLEANTALPSVEFPSDHLPVVVDVHCHQ